MTKYEYEKLKNEIKYHMNLYYNQDDPELSDYDYDQLMNKLKEAEKKNPEWVTEDSPTQYVGGIASKSDFEKITHVIPMLSLQDVFSKNEIKEFLNKHPADTIYSVEQKIDGLSMSVTYVDGKMVMAETRGDGLIGEVCFENAKGINGLPNELKNVGSIDSKNIKLLEVRCEVYLPISEFERINKEHELSGERIFKNPRNAAAGILRTKNPAAVKAANLAAFVFNVQRVEFYDNVLESCLGWNSHINSLDNLIKLGFDCVTHYPSTSSAVNDWIDYIGKNKSSLPYWIDGAVVKIDNINSRNEIGDTAKYPKWAVAYKYPPEEKVTVVRDIVLQTGRTGRVTPVAIFDPVILAGTQVSKATLHNPQIIKALNVNIGDTILVRKAAEIVPEVIKTIKKGDNTKNNYYDVIAHKCPSCGGVIESDKDGNGAFCNNPECPAQILRHFIFFASRDCMDIRNLGPAQIEQFIALGWLKTIPDIYKLKNHREEMINLDGYQQKSVDKLLDSIEKSKNNDIDRLIKSLGIPGVGRHIGKTLAKLYPNLFRIGGYEIGRQTKNDKINELANINGIGNMSAKAIVDYFNSKNCAMLFELKRLGVNLNSKSFKASATTGVLSGKTFVITGTLPTLKREEAAELIEANGGNVASSVSKKTNYLLCGENAGSKLKKAESLSVKILNEEEFKKMLE